MSEHSSPAPLTAATTITPTPPAAITPILLTAVAGWALAFALLCYSLVALERFVNPEATLLPRVVFAAVLLAALLPLIPLVRAGRGALERGKLLQHQRLAEARHVSAVSREDAFVTLGFSGGIVIVGMLISLIMANDAAIATTFLNLEFIGNSWGDVARAFWVNVQVAIGAEIIVLIAGLIVAIMRLLPGRAGRPLRWIATIYVDVFRAIPSIIVIYLVGFGLSIAQVPFFKDLSPIALAIIALALTYTGYVAEVYRAGLESIHPSQWAAARSLGLSYGQTLRQIIVPQAFNRMIPPLLNDFIGLQKDTALIGIMGVVDAFMQSRLYASAHFNLSPVTVVAIVFVIATIPQARFVDYLIAKNSKQYKAGAQ